MTVPSFTIPLWLPPAIYLTIGLVLLLALLVALVVSVKQTWRRDDAHRFDDCTPFTWGEAVERAVNELGGWKEAGLSGILFVLAWPLVPYLMRRKARKRREARRVR